jgi:hypothetical protein
MPQESFQNKDIIKSQALTEIEAIRQQIQQGGNVDAENDQFNMIRQNLASDTITPEKALELARSVPYSRQDYH